MELGLDATSLSPSNRRVRHLLSIDTHESISRVRVKYHIYIGVHFYEYMSNRCGFV